MLDIFATCNSCVVGTEEVSNMKLFPNNFTANLPMTAEFEWSKQL